MPGDALQVEATFENKSRQSCRPIARLVQIVRHFDDEEEMARERIVVAELVGSTIARRASRTWTQKKFLDLPVPLAPSIVANRQADAMLSNEYQLEVSV